MDKILLFLFLFFIKNGIEAQNNLLHAPWEKVFQYSSDNINVSENDSILYAYCNQNYYESRDTGKTWFLKIEKGDRPVFLYDDFILASGSHTTQAGSGTQPTISESWVKSSRGNLNFRSLGYTTSNCGWHSGICHTWGAYKICDSVAEYYYIENGYRVTDPYIDRYFVDNKGNPIRSVPNIWKANSFISQYGLIGFRGREAIAVSGNNLIVEGDSVSHPIPFSNIPNLKIAFWGNKCFVFKANGTVWTSTNWGNWTSNTPLRNIAEIEHTHGLFIAKTNRGFFKATPADSLIWQPLYLNGISGLDSLTSINVFKNLLLASANGKIYRSFNGGTTWDAVVTEGLDCSSNTVFVNVLNNTVRLNYDGRLIAIDTIGRVFPIYDAPFANNLPLDTMRRGQFWAINNANGLFFSQDSGRTWLQSNSGLFQNIFFLGNYLYGVNRSSVWRVKPQNLTCFGVQKNINYSMGCYGVCYFGNDTLTKPGTYIKKFQTTLGCDSIVKLNLTITYAYLNDNQTLKLCKNIEYYFAGQRVTRSGYYYKNDTLPSGCVVYRTRNITIVDEFLFQNEITVHEGDTVRNVRIGARDTIFKTVYQSIGGCDSTYALYVHVIPSTTAVSDLMGNDDSITLFPNPMQKTFDVRFTEGIFNQASMTVYDAHGAVVYQTVLKSGTQSVNTEGWQTGLFLVKIETNKGTVIQKLVKN